MSDSLGSPAQDFNHLPGACLAAGPLAKAPCGGHANEFEERADGTDRRYWPAQALKPLPAHSLAFALNGRLTAGPFENKALMGSLARQCGALSPSLCERHPLSLRLSDAYDRRVARGDRR
jgi:hypothetical protein